VRVDHLALDDRRSGRCVVRDRRSAVERRGIDDRCRAHVDRGVPRPRPQGPGDELIEHGEGTERERRIGSAPCAGRKRGSN